ncbi:MAG: hypothetical protein LBC80_01620 [Treponema sp.]|jgi:hypothetical protein|nr:hypothetical protein [Treponema sp.]
MKRSIFTVIILCVLFCTFVDWAFTQNTTPVDLVLILDSSAAMSSSYENVNNYLTGPFLSEFLRVGDTFHLIAFSAAPRLDVARRVIGVGDVETIIGRILLQYPVEVGSNPSAAITFAERYIATLPSRPNKIVLVSSVSAETSNLVTSARQRLQANTTIDFIQVTPGQPLSNLPSSGRAQIAPRTEPPTTIERTDVRTDIIETQQTEETDSQATQEIESMEIIETGETQEGIEHLQEDVVAGTETTLPGFQVTVPQESNESFASSFTFIIIIIIVILLILGLIIFLLTRRLGSSPNRVMYQVASSGSEPEERFKDHSKDLESFASGTARRTTPYEDRPVKTDDSKTVYINPSGPLVLNLFVEEQATIGKRNIHSLKSGYNLTVGGGKSDDYHIFLVPMPSNLGIIRRDGSKLTFIPRKPKYFPELGSKELKDCINKTIRIVSDKKFEIRFRFEKYEDPLAALNRLLNSIKVPG